MSRPVFHGGVEVAAWRSGRRRETYRGICGRIRQSCSDSLSLALPPPGLALILSIGVVVSVYAGTMSLHAHAGAEGSRFFRAASYGVGNSVAAFLVLSLWDDAAALSPIGNAGWWMWVKCGVSVLKGLLRIIPLLVGPDNLPRSESPEWRSGNPAFLGSWLFFCMFSYGSNFLVLPFAIIPYWEALWRARYAPWYKELFAMVDKRHLLSSSPQLIELSSRDSTDSSPSPTHLSSPRSSASLSPLASEATRPPTSHAASEEYPPAVVVDYFRRNAWPCIGGTGWVNSSVGGRCLDGIRTSSACPPPYWLIFSTLIGVLGFIAIAVQPFDVGVVSFASPFALAVGVGSLFLDSRFRPLAVRRAEAGYTHVLSLYFEALPVGVAFTMTATIEGAAGAPALQVAIVMFFRALITGILWSSDQLSHAWTGPDPHGISWMKVRFYMELAYEALLELAFLEFEPFSASYWVLLFVSCTRLVLVHGGIVSALKRRLCKALSRNTTSVPKWESFAKKLREGDQANGRTEEHHPFHPPVLQPVLNPLASTRSQSFSTPQVATNPPELPTSATTAQLLATQIAVVVELLGTLAVVMALVLEDSIVQGTDNHRLLTRSFQARGPHGVQDAILAMLVLFTFQASAGWAAWVLTVESVPPSRRLILSNGIRAAWSRCRAEGPSQSCPLCPPPRGHRLLEHQDTPEGDILPGFWAENVLDLGLKTYYGIAVAVSGAFRVKGLSQG